MHGNDENPLLNTEFSWQKYACMSRKFVKKKKIKKN